MVGFDSYAFLQQSCGAFVVPHLPLLADFVTKAIPCNIYAIKGTLFLLFLASLLGIAHLGELFHKEKGWLAAVFSFLSPGFFFEFTKFENDQFAIPILVWAAYFFFKARQTKDKRFDLVSITLILLAAGFWNGSIYWLIGLGTTSLLLGIPALAAIFWFRNELVSNTMPKNVLESMPVIGLAMIGGLAFGFSLLPVQMYPVTLIFFLLMLLQAKFAWFVVPFLSVGVLMLYTNERIERFQAGRFGKGVLISLAFFLVVAWGFSVQGHPPHPYQWEAVEFAIEQSETGYI